MSEVAIEGDKTYYKYLFIGNQVFYMYIHVDL